jgi:outer membrane protein assembly factor BamB
VIRRGGSLLLALGLVACSGGPALRVTEPPAPLGEFEPRLEVTEVWSRSVGDGVGDRYLTLPPLADGETVFAADRHGRVVALDARNGAERWSVSVHAALNAGPGDGGDLLLLGGDAEVIALAKGDGAVRWRVAVSSEVLGAPTRAGELVLAQTVDGNVTALAAADGLRQWRYNQSVPSLSLRGVASPVAVPGGVIAGFATGRVVALGIADGSPAWDTAVAIASGRTEIERLVDVDATPVVRDGVVYAGAFQGRVAAIALSNGQLLWARDIPAHRGLGVDERSLYVVDDHGDLFALSRYDGGTLWRQDALHARGLSGPVVQGRYLVVGDFDGYLHWLDGEDGQIVARARLGGERILAPPVVVGERVYAINTNGRLAAFRVAPRQPNS